MSRQFNPKHLDRAQRKLRRLQRKASRRRGPDKRSRQDPSSKTCNDCGVVKAKLRLSERTLQCDACGMSSDRDHNAARNLAGLVDEATGSASSPSCGATVNEPAGNPGKTSHAGVGYRHGKTAPSGAAKAA